MNNQFAELVYVHDPMCSWCWGFDRTRRELLGRLDGTVTVRRLLGGLAPDSDEPMPEAMRSYLQTTWQKIEQRIPGTRFNFDFWQKCKPRRSTWPACRAVIAARLQGDKYDELMTHAIQEAYYLQARNPSDNSELISIAEETGLDTELFTHALLAPETHQQLLQEIEQAKLIDATGFPSLVFVRGVEKWRIPVDYTNSVPMFELTQELLKK